MANAITYIKNVGKSIGYASFDVIKETNPVFSGFAETNGELASDMYKSIRDLKKKIKGTPNAVMESKYGKFGQTYLENLKSDLKTGKFYNKERINSDMMGSYGGDDFNFDFGEDDDLNFSQLESSNDDDFSTNDMIDLVGEKTSNAISNAMARSAEYIVESNTEANKAMYNQMNAIYGGIHAGMSTINKNLANMIEFSNENVIAHFENSRTFYTEITRMDQERNLYLKDILENVKAINNPPKKTNLSSKTTYSDIVTFDGVLDISRYVQNVKKNIKNSSGGGMLSMIDMMLDPDFMPEFISSPVSGLMKLLITASIPANIKKSTDKLNKSISGLFGNALIGLKEKGKEFGIWNTIAEIFGINTSLKTKLDPSKYEKGKIPFDGVTKKAIVEVIPTYLAKILSALNKQPESRFNYDTGKFVSVNELKKEFENITKDSANRAAYEIDSVVRTKKKSLSFRNKEEERQFDEDWEAIKEYLYTKQKTFNTRDRKLTGKSFNLKGGMASDVNVRILQELLDGTSENMRYAHELFREIDNQNQRMMELENSSSYNSLFNNSIDELPMTSSDKGAASKKGNRKSKKSKDKVYNKAQENIRNNAYGTSEIDKESEVARIMGKVKEDDPHAKSDKKSFSQRMNEASGMSAKIAVLAESASELAKKPAKFIVSVLDKADERLYDLIYGPKDDKSGRKSFVGRMFNGMEKIFNKFSNFLDEHIIEPFKKVFNKENMKDATNKILKAFGLDNLYKDVKEYLFNKEDGFFSKFTKDFKDGFKGAFNWVKDAFRSVGDWVGFTSKKNKKGQEKEQRNNTLMNIVSNISEAATGIKRVDKTGLAVISEGEMIVPPDMNPFNIAKRRRNEKQVKNKLKSSIDSIFEYAEGTSDATSGKGFTKEEKEAFSKDDYEEGRNPFFDRVLNEFSNLWKAIKNTTDTFGMSDKDIEKFKKNATDFIGNVKEYSGTMAAGAVIGAGVSTITGLLGGPLVGAAVGAGVGLLKKSETMQKMLFGDIDKETGERKGGFIPKSVTNAIKKYLPDMGKGAAVGGILSMLPFIPGGPVSGVILGSAIGFAKNNQTIQDALFGFGNKGVENKEKFQKKIQRVLPKMGAGALAGLLVGPFGPAANIILGSALGFATDTDMFKDLMFGKVIDKETGEREGGILKSITNPATEFFKKTFEEFREFMQKDMIDPVKNAIAPLANEFKLMGRRITDDLGKMFKENIGRPLEQKLERIIISPLGKFFKIVINTALKPTKAILSAPSKIIGAVGDSLRRKRIRRGQADYMSAAQRNSFRASKGEIYMGGPDSYEEWDRSLENASYDDLDIAKTSLQAVLNSRRSTAQESHTSYKSIYNEIYSKDNKVDTHIAKAALDMVKHGNYEQAIKFVRDANIEQASKTRIIAKLTSESAKMKMSNAMRNNSEEAANLISENLNKLGIKVDPEKLKNNPSEIKKYLDMIETEQSFKKPDEIKTEGQKQHDEIVDVLKQIRDAIIGGDRVRVDKDGNVITDGKVKDSLKAQENRYKWVAGLSTNPEDENAAPGEIDSTRGKIRAGYSNVRSAISGTYNEIRDSFKSSFTDIKNAGREFVGSVKGTGTYKKYFGDGNTDYLKRMSDLTTVMAEKEGIDTKKINPNMDAKKVVSSAKTMFNKAKQSVTHFVDGFAVKFIKDKNGDEIPDTGNAENKEYYKYRNEQQKTQKGILTGLTALPLSLGNLLGQLFGKDKDKDKKSFFEQILDFFKGGDGVKVSLSSILLKAIPAALVALGLTGKLDNIASKLSGGLFGKRDSNDTLMTTDSNGNKVEIMLNENGDPITDADGNYVSKSGQVLSSDSYLQTTKSNATMSLSDRLKNNFIRGTVTGKGSIVGKTFGTDKVIKSGVNALKNINDAKLIQVADQIMDRVGKWTNALKKVFKTNKTWAKFINKIDDLALDLADTLTTQVSKKGIRTLSEIGEAIPVIGWVITAATAVMDFTTGWQDASTILKIKAENITTPQKIICGLVRTVKNFIPIIGTFIPDQLITDLFINHVSKWFGISTSEIKKQQDEAAAELAEFNAANGTNYSWADYNKKELGNYTWTEKIGNTVSSAVTNIKEKGLGGAISSAVKSSKAGQWVSDKANKLAEGAKSIGGKVADGITNLTKPIFDEINKRIGVAKDLGSYAVNVAKDTLKEILTGKDIVSDNLAIEDDDPYAAQKKIIWNVSKIMTFPVSSLTKLGRFLWEKAFKPIVDGIKNIGSNIGTSIGSMFSKAWKGDLVGAITEGGAETGQPVVDFISKALFGVIKPFIAVPSLLTSGVGLVVRNFDNIVNGVKNIGSNVGSTIGSMFSKAWQGDLIGMITTTTAETGNPLTNTISKVVFGAIKPAITIPALLTSAVGCAVDKIKAVIDTISNAKSSDADKAIIDKSNNGEISVFSKEYWKINTNTNGIAGAIQWFNSAIEKVMNIPTALLAQIKLPNLIEKLTSWGADILGFDDSETKPSSGKGSKLHGRGSGANESFISQVDPRYRNKQFNISGDSQVQTLGDTGCAPAAAAMAINSTLGSQAATMENASKLALKYKVKDDGVNASYFNDEFARHGIYAKYISDSDLNTRSQEISRQLMNNNKVVLMGQDITNRSKTESPFGPNPHYVVATGLSKDGKYIYINDPESNTPNIRYSASRVLGTSKLGISANVARGTKMIHNRFKQFIGRGSYGKDTIEYKVWNSLRAAGYNEIAAAAAMGNIKHESGFNPSAIEKGSGAGFGLVQWTGGRRTAIENYARQKGASASSLELQIEYLLMELAANSGIWTKASSKYGFGSLSRNDWANGKDLVKATKAFMCCFERPSYDRNINHIDRRLAAASEYLEAFTGMKVDTNLNFETTSYSSSTTNTTSTSDSGNVITKLLSAFSGLAKAYGLDDSSSTDNTDSYGNSVANSATGNTVSDEEKANKQKLLVEKMYSIQGQLKYAQDNAKYPGSRNPEDGSGDCSSTIQWAYKKVLGIDPGSWTGAQRTNPNTYTVATNTKDESVLQLGDLLLKDGHVEMYAGNNTMIGHGGGNDGKKLGPTVKPLDQSGKYNLVRRWVGFRGAGSGLFGRGSDHPTNTPYNSALQYIKSNEFNSILPFGIEDKETDRNNISLMQYNSNTLSKKPEVVDIKSTSTHVGRAAQVNNSTGISTNVVTLLNSIIKLLADIVTNTDQLNNIAKLAAQYVSAVTNDKIEKSEQSKETVVLAKQSLLNAMQGAQASNEPNAQLMRLIEATERIARE